MKLLRPAIRYLLLVPVGIVAATILGSLVERAANETGLSDRLYGWMLMALGLFSSVVEQPWFAWAGGVALGLATGVWMDAILRRWESSTGENPQLLASQTSADPDSEQIKRLMSGYRGTWGAGDQERLANRLKKLRGDGADPLIVDIEYGPSSRRALARRLADLFEQAEWDVRFNQMAQEPWKPGYPTGIRVECLNGYRAEQVADAFTEAGILDLHTELRNVDIGPTNPKWPIAQRTVYILIGDSEEVRF